MKVLKALLLRDEATTKEVFLNAVKDFNIEVEWIEDEEKAIDLMTNGHYSLLVIDRALDATIIHKVDKISSYLFEGAATIILDLADEIFVHFKMHQIMFQWRDAQGGGGLQLFDNPAY